MNVGSGNALRSCQLLVLCVVACTGELEGQPGREPSSEEDCHTLELNRRGYRQSPQDVFDAFPNQSDVPLFWVNGAIEDSTDRFEQADVSAETRLSFSLEYDSSRETTECVSRTQTCRSGTCTLSKPTSGYMTVPVTVKLATEDGLDAVFAMDLYGEAPTEPYPLLIPALQWPGSNHEEPYTPPALSSDAEWGMPGFGEFAMSFVGYTFLGRFHHPERGLAVFPTPCGGQLQVAPSEIVFGQPESTASMFEAIGSRQLMNVDDSSMPNLTVTVSMQDTTACYDIRGRYHLDLQVNVDTDGATFEGSTTVAGSFSEGDDALALWEGVCGDVSGSAVWSALFESSIEQNICLDALVQKTEDGYGLVAEVTTQAATAEGHRIAWGYSQ